VGWKANLFGNRVHTQLGGFYYDYKDFQVVFYQPQLAAGIDVNAPGHTRIDGVEAQAQGQFGAWSLDFGASYVDSSIASIQAIDARNPAAGPVDLSGKQQPYAPNWTVQVGVQYAFELPGASTLTPRLDYGMVGARWATLFEVSPGDRLAEQDLVNAQVVYQRPDNWRVTIYATNLFDEHYVAALGLANLAVAGPPRQFGVRVFKSF
jgi:iron complex outermembrane receptor protein